ncbi:MAG: hypothetical protein V1672_05155 [Candidatus Diapherotrites archaeon]
MTFNLVQESFRQYLYNIKASLAFGLTLIFVLIFTMFDNIGVSTGSIFLEYGLSNIDLASLAIEIIAILAFLLFYALFLTVIVFSIRNSLSFLKVSYYLREMIQKFTSRLFLFYVFYFGVIFIIAQIMLFFNISILFTNAILLIISVAFLFVPQSVVIDEEGLRNAFLNNFEFIVKNPKHVLLVLVLGMFLLALVSVVEYMFDAILLMGRYVSLFIVIAFVMPFLESLKSCMYMFKFEIIRDHQMNKPKL